MTDMINFEPRQGGSGPIDLGSLDGERIRRTLRWGLWVLGLILLWAALGWTRGFYTDWLWFRQLGYEEVLVKIVTTRIVLFTLAALFFLGLALVGMRGAVKSSGRPPLAGARLEALDYHFAQRFLVRGAVVATLVAAVFLGMFAAAEWETVLLALDSVPFGETDPIFGRDFSFYIFTLPALRLAHGWLLTALVSFGLLLVGFHYATSNLRGDPNWLGGAVRKQLAILGAMLLLLVAVGHWLARYDLLFSPTGTVFGVGYTDDHVTLPGLTLLTIVAVATAGVILAGGLFSKGYRWLIGPVVTWLILLILVGSVAPWLMQRLRVEPAELALEREYLASNIEFTDRKSLV